MTARRFLDAAEEAIYRRSPRLITPSRIDPWEGGYDADERFSRAQLYSLRVRGLDASAVESVDVEVAGQANRIWIPLVTYFYRRVSCPIIGKVGERLKVISPGGVAKLVYPDGSITRRRAGR